MKTQIPPFHPSMARTWLFALNLALLIPSQTVAVGTWTPLVNQAPAAAGHLMLLSDGTVMVQNSDAPLDNTTNWYRLTPDTHGSYTNGTWSRLASSRHSRFFYESFVIPDGRVVFAGGEYGTGANDVEVYDPVSNTWTLPVPSPLPNIGDASSELLPDGNLLVSPWYCNLSPPFRTLIYNPTSNTWSDGPPSIGSQNEATWIKLPDDSILTIDRCLVNGSCDTNDHSPALCYTNTERYIPSLNRWIADAPLPPNSRVWSQVEIGAALLLPNGNAFFLGANGRTALYTPSGNTNPGSWAPGASIPNGLVTQDAPAAMLVNGKILCALHQLGSNNTGPVYFYEYDYLANSFTQVSSPTGGVTDTNTGANRVSMLILPDGKMLFSDTTRRLYVYTPDGFPLAAGQPTIQSITVNPDGSYLLTGTGLNGISAGAAYGDDAQMNSNYPLVRLTDGSGHVFYARTYRWSSTGVMTGNRVLSTRFDVPPTLSPGQYSLAVVANGISSNPVSFFSGAVWVDFNYGGTIQTGTYSFPYKTLTQGVNAVPFAGLIKIKTAGSTAETMTISNAMSIVAVGGPATIGR